MMDSPVRTNNLAYAFQESFTAILRVGSQRQQVNDAESFRAQIRRALQSAMSDARGLGYSSEAVQMAVFALVAFLDESVLHLQSPIFSDWARRPMQEELFGGHTGGEVFFRNFQSLLSRPDAAEWTDCLEIYCLCMLLGFKGRYALAGRGELQSYIRQGREKIARVRGNSAFLKAPPPPPAVKVTTRRDSASRWLGIAAACLAVAAAAAYAGLALDLGRGASQVQKSSINPR
jgi:type VI secretion system protein ImpK